MLQIHSFRQGCWTASAAAALLAGTLAGITGGGCASPGNPRPPSLHLEEVPAAPQASRVGDQVVLHWTTPISTTDGGRVQPPLIAVVCRERVLQGVGAGMCAPVLRMVVIAGAAADASDPLPRELLGTRALLAYRVEIQNVHGRSAGFSQPGFAAAGPAPAPAGALTVAGRPEGALVTWAGSASSGVMELTRTSAASAPIKSAAKTAGGTGQANGFATDPAAPVLLRAGGSGSAPPDGMLDRSVLDARAEGMVFRYVAQRVESLRLGQHVLELRGLPSPPVTFAYTHTFAPGAPAGLIAIPSLSPNAIDLSWEASDAADLLGYNVYRRAAAETGFKLLNTRPIAVPSFRDLGVVPGRTYVYRVTTLDRHHNQSVASAEVTEAVNP